MNTTEPKVEQIPQWAGFAAGDYAIHRRKSA